MDDRERPHVVPLNVLLPPVVTAKVPEIEQAIKRHHRPSGHWRESHAMLAGLKVPQRVRALGPSEAIDLRQSVALG